MAELRPGGPWVHHIVSSHMGVGVPGRGPFTHPEGWGVLLPEDPFITVNMHYHKDPAPGSEVYDDTRAAFKFYEDGDVIDHVVETKLLPHRDWTIPAGHDNYEVNNTFEVEEDIYLLSSRPWKPASPGAGPGPTTISWCGPAAMSAAITRFGSTRATRCFSPARYR